MSNKSSVTLSAAIIFAAFLTAVLFMEEFSVLAQNANSSTPEESMQSTNANMTRRGRRRGRRGRRRPAANANADASMDANLSTDANVSAETSGGMSANLGGGVDEDLSGTYTGHVTMSGGHEMSGQGTLTITGNSFTLESEGMNHTGRVRAVTTRGYTGATFWFTDLTDTATNTPLAASVRARKSGDNLWLSPVPGSRNRLTFTTGRTGRGRHRRGH